MWKVQGLTRMRKLVARGDGKHLFLRGKNSGPVLRLGGLSTRTVTEEPHAPRSLRN